MSNLPRFESSRRTFLKGLGLGALALGVGGRAQMTRAQASAGEVSAFYRFQVGDFQITAIQDGTAGFPPEFFAQNAEPGEVAAVLEENNFPARDSFTASINVVVAQSADRTVLLDTGYGSLTLNPSSPPPGGRLAATLSLLGIGVDTVTDVLISHFHPDHIGLISDGQAPTFPNAAYHFPQGDYDFITSGVVTGNEMADALIQIANSMLAPISQNDQLQLYSGEAEPVPGFQTIPTPGHSPGHTAILLNSNGSSLLNTVDSAVNYIISLANPGWHFGFDADPELAVESRRMILNRAADEQLPVFGYHFPFPGVGVIDRDGDGFRFVPTP